MTAFRVNAVIDELTDAFGPYTGPGVITDQPYGPHVGLITAALGTVQGFWSLDLEVTDDAVVVTSVLPHTLSPAKLTARSLAGPLLSHLDVTVDAGRLRSTCDDPRRLIQTIADHLLAAEVVARLCSADPPTPIHDTDTEAEGLKHGQ